MNRQKIFNLFYKRTKTLHLYIFHGNVFQKQENDRENIGKLTADDIFQTKSGSDVSIGSKNRTSRDQANRELANRVRHLVTNSS